MVARAGAGAVAAAEALADEVLFPAALEVDRRGVLPRSHLDAVADAGLYGLLGPVPEGGLAADETTRLGVTEALAAGCLTTAFVWAQHHSAVVAVDQLDDGPLRRELLGPLCRGKVRAGVAFAGLRRPGPPVLRAEPAGAGWTLHGTAPWVSGWGLVDVVHVAARTDAGAVVWALLDAGPAVTWWAEPLELVAAQASATVTVHFEAHPVPADRVTLVESVAAWRRRDAAGLRPNGALALGVTRRCEQLSGRGRFASELERCRRGLLDAPTEALPPARAAATDLALRAAAGLMMATGGRAVLRTEQAQRLAREALFLSVLGQTAAIRRTQLTLLEHRHEPRPG